MAHTEGVMKAQTEASAGQSGRGRPQRTLLPTPTLQHSVPADVRHWHNNNEADDTRKLQTNEEDAAAEEAPAKRLRTSAV